MERGREGLGLSKFVFQIQAIWETLKQIPEEKKPGEGIFQNIYFIVNFFKSYMYGGATKHPKRCSWDLIEML